MGLKDRISIKNSDSSDDSRGCELYSENVFLTSLVVVYVILLWTFVQTFGRCNEDHTLRVLVDQPSNEIDLLERPLNGVEMLGSAGHVG